jgi:hypothetical protein
MHHSVTLFVPWKLNVGRWKFDVARCSIDAISFMETGSYGRTAKNVLKLSPMIEVGRAEPPG